MKEKLFDRTMFKFILVGVVNTFVGSGIMFLLYNVANCSYWLSSVANYAIGSIVSFFLNKYFTFQNHERSWNQILRFAANTVVCYLLAYGTAKPIIRYLLTSWPVKLRENIAMLLGMGFYTILNYFGQRFFAFR